MKIYFAPNTRAVRIVWLFEELGLPYEIEMHKLGDPRMRSPEFLAINPMGRVPAIEDGDLVLCESGAIVEYVLAKYGEGQFVPDTSAPEFGPYLQWLHYAEGMIMPPVNTIVVETILLPPERKNQVNVDRANKLLNRMMGVVDEHLKGREYLAGDFSGADFMTGHACAISARLGADISDKPNLAAYIDRLNARPALKRAWELGA